MGDQSGSIENSNQELMNLSKEDVESKIEENIKMINKMGLNFEDLMRKSVGGELSSSPLEDQRCKIDCDITGSSNKGSNLRDSHIVVEKKMTEHTEHRSHYSGTPFYSSGTPRGEVFQRKSSSTKLIIENNEEKMTQSAAKGKGSEKFPDKEKTGTHFVSKNSVKTAENRKDKYNKKIQSYNNSSRLRQENSLAFLRTSPGIFTRAGSKSKMTPPTRPKKSFDQTADIERPKINIKIETSPE
jgi:hypothetical protein